MSAVQLQRVRDYITKGHRRRGSTALWRGHAARGLEQGYYVRPTIFSDVRNDMTIAREEIFGPVLSIIPYDTEDEAIEIANDSLYGLAGGVWAEYRREGLRSRAQDPHGSGRDQRRMWNFVAPFGGYKQSGIGRELGQFGFEEFLEVKSSSTTKRSARRATV